jgi:hypothetical protein
VILRSQKIQIDINAAHTKAFAATNDYLWECKPNEYQHVIQARDIICSFMIDDKELPNEIKQHNISVINQKSIRTYPNKRERLWKF